MKVYITYTKIVEYCLDLEYEPLNSEGSLSENVISQINAFIEQEKNEYFIREKQGQILLLQIPEMDYYEEY